MRSLLTLFKSFTQNKNLETTVITSSNVRPFSFVLNWETVENAQTYEVYVNNILKTTTSFTTATITGLTENTTYNIIVRSLATGYTLSNSFLNVTTSQKYDLDTLTYNIVDTTQTTIEFNINPISNAGSYIVTLNGNLIQNSSNTNIVLTGLEDDTVYSFTIQAISNNIEYNNGEIVEFTIKTDVAPTKLQTPVLLSQQTTNSTIDIDVYAVPTATSYEYYLNNNLITTTASTTYLFTGLTINTLYEIKIIAKAVGYIDSNPLIFNASTSELDGDRIEDFGADPVYILKYNQFTVEPLPLENKSLVTYTGLENIFEPSFVNRIEFVLFKAHKNPDVFPASNVLNGNYIPSETSSRYSKVVDYISPKSVKVDFVYNGGNINTPITTTNGSGYFFFDNRQAFRNAFHLNTSRNVKVYLKEGKTYVTKGGWSSEIRKELRLLSDGNNSSIKISIEDAFSFDVLTGQSYNFNTASLNTTFNSSFFFLLTNENDGQDINVENINILPSHYCINSAQYANGYLSYPFFSHYYNTIGAQRASVNRVFNSNGMLEKESCPILANQPNFLLPQFAFSNDGGKRNISNTDVETYQEFILENSQWEAIQFHNIKYQKTNGNLLRLKGTSLNKTKALIKDINNELNFTNHNVRIESDEFGNKRILKINNDFSLYKLANQYWYGNNVISIDTFTNTSDRLQWIKIPKDGVDYYIYLPNQKALQQIYNNAYGQSPTIRSGSEINLYEEIPVAGVTTINIDGVINKKVSNTEFQIYGWGLQATTTYPSYNDNLGVQTLPIGDIIRYNGVDYTVIERKRITSSGPNPLQTVPGWRIKINNPITDSNPNFLVVSSNTQFLIDGTFRPATIKTYTVGGYFCYSSVDLNFIFEHAEFNGYGRYTSNPKNDNGTEHVFSLNSPKYLLGRWQTFKDSSFVGNLMSWEYAGASTLQLRNLIEGVTTYGRIIDNSRVWTSRYNNSTNPVFLRNNPIIIDGGGFGEARLCDVTTDGTGITLEGGASFMFTNVLPSYNLRNIYVKTNPASDIIDVNIAGKGNVDISGFNAEFNTVYNVFPGINYLRANGFSNIPIELNLVGDGGISGIIVDGEFSNNSLSLTTWQLRSMSFNGTGYRRNNLTWPASPTESFPNFSITNNPV